MGEHWRDIERNGGSHLGYTKKWKRLSWAIRIFHVAHNSFRVSHGKQEDFTWHHISYIRFKDTNNLSKRNKKSIKKMMFQMTDWGRHADPRGAGGPGAHPLLWYSPYREVSLIFPFFLGGGDWCDIYYTGGQSHLDLNFSGVLIFLAIFFISPCTEERLNTFTQNTIHLSILHEINQSVQKKLCFHEEMTYSGRWHSTGPLSTLITTKRTNVMCERAHAMSYVMQCHMLDMYI